MSILLSVYFPEGIVFATDKNMTRCYADGDQDVDVGTATKVIPWPQRRAVVGYCGLAELVGIPMDEWLRQFVAQTRNFTSLESLAMQLQQQIQHDSSQDYPPGENCKDAGLIIHLGGFRTINGVSVPAMYLISNIPCDQTTGKYGDATRTFNQPTDQMANWQNPPSSCRQQIEEIYKKGGLIWFNNGCDYPVFNVLKETLWAALNTIKQAGLGILPTTGDDLEDRVAYCKIAIELFGSFFANYYEPRDRSVGGGVDTEWVAWPM